LYNAANGPLSRYVVVRWLSHFEGDFALKQNKNIRENVMEANDFIRFIVDKSR
jgi:hypothetical protein